MRLWSPSFALALIGVLALGCSGGERADEDSAPTEANRLSVYVVNYPLQYFAERLGGVEVDVSFPVPLNEDPAYWSPSPETISAYQAADLILLNGAGYARWVERVTLPEMKLVDTSVTFRERLIPRSEGPVHSHGPEGDHSHTGYASTSWLDPILATEHARSIRDVLGRSRPDRMGVFQKAFERLETDLRAQGERWASVSATLAGEPLLFSHPVYQYLIRRFELNGESVHWEPGEAPDEAQWQELDELVARHPARWMIWEAEPLPETADRLRAAGIESLVYRPNAVPPEEGDLLAAFDADLEAIEMALAARR